MRLLLDTHIYLWWLQANPKLSDETKALICTTPEIYVSSASIWEAAIKSNLGKLDANIDRLVSEITNNGFIELAVTAQHAATVKQLADIHKDPFDRILLAQAMSEPLHFLTADSLLAGYSDLVKLAT